MNDSSAFSRLVPRIGTEAAERCERHWRLVQQWQKTTNLTGIHEDERAVTMHYEDALEALHLWPEGARLCDVGSGAGFPGLVLAAVRPHAEITLLEPRRLRIEFLRAAKEELALDHVRIVAATLGSAAAVRADCMTMRAVFARDTQLDACAKHLSPNGRLLVFRQGDAHCEGKPTRFACVRRHAYHLSGHPSVRSLDEWRLRS